MQLLQDLTELDVFDLSVPIMADTETDGLYGIIRTIQLYQPETHDKVILIDTDKISLSNTIEYLKKMYLVFHNATYDFSCFGFVTEQFEDTLWLARVSYQNLNTGTRGNFALDKLVAKFGFTDIYKGLDKSSMQKEGFKKGAYLSRAQLRYACADVKALHAIYNLPKIQKAKENFAYIVGKITLKNTIHIQQKGLSPDKVLTQKEYNLAKEKHDANELKLNGLNVRSPKQVKAKFAELFNVSVDSIGATDAKMLLTTILKEEGNPIGDFAKIVYEQRKLKLRLVNLTKYLSYDKFYTFFNPLGANTGRFTSNGSKDVLIKCDNPRYDEKGKLILNSLNFQNITRDLQYLFQQNKPGFVHIHADYSTAELRAGCSIMGDETMYKYLKKEIDLHKVAATIADPSIKLTEVTKPQRQKGKAVNFGFLFGMGANTFIEYAYTGYGVTFSKEEALKVRNNYLSTYRQVGLYAKYWWDNYQNKLTTTPMGWPSKPRNGTDAINHATQGCIAETVRLAAHYLIKEYPEARNYITNIVHDCIDGLYPEDEAELWAERIVWAMKLAWTEECKLDMLKFKDIPMPVEYSYVDPKTNKYVEKEI